MSSLEFLECSIAKEQEHGTALDTDQNTTSPETILTGNASPADVEKLEEVAGKDWTGDCAVYSYNAGM